MKTFREYTDVVNPAYAVGGASIGPGMGQYLPTADLNLRAQRNKNKKQLLGPNPAIGYQINHKKPIKKSDLDQLEKYADRLFAAVGIDVEFTRHFLDRVNDRRNQIQITPAELTRLFKQSFKKYGKVISKLGPDAEGVITDMRTDINMPFVIDLKGGQLELVAKTVMRKKNFKTSNQKLAFEGINEGRAKKAVAGGKVQKLVTAFGYSFKGKNYKEIDMELVSIDNSSQIVTFNIIHPAEIFGNEMKIPFRTLRRGRFMATDTSKINEGIGEPNIFSQKNPRIPRKKGQPAGSKKHSDLYTDEDPRGTIHGLGFKDVETARASVKKIESSDRSHAHKLQAAIAMEQRARVMGKTAEADIYRAYIDKMKKKTKEMKKEDAHGFKCPPGYKFDRKLMACVPKKTKFKTVYAYPYFGGGTKSGDQSGETQSGQNGNGNGNAQGGNGNGGNGNGGNGANGGG